MTILTRERVLQIIASARVRGEKPELFGANLSEAELRRADIRQANLSRANLTRTNLNGANLSGVRYDQATIWPANFNPTYMGAIRED